MPENPWNSKLISAAAAGDIDAAREALAHDADIQNNWHAPLIEAVKNRRTGMVRFLIANGAMDEEAVKNATNERYDELNIQTVYEALRQAVQNDDAELCRLLLEQGIDLKAKSYLAAHDAIRGLRLNAIPVLIEYGLDKNQALSVAIDEVHIRTPAPDFMRPVSEKDLPAWKADQERRIALVQRFLELGKGIPNINHEIWKNEYSNPEIRALCVGHAGSEAHDACAEFGERLKAEAAALNLLPCPERKQALLDADSAATSLLRQLAAARMLPLIFDTKDWREHEPQAGELVREIRLALPERYHTRLHNVDIAPFKPEPLSHVVKMIERQTLGGVVRR